MCWIGVITARSSENTSFERLRTKRRNRIAKPAAPRSQAGTLSSGEQAGAPRNQRYLSRQALVEPGMTLLMSSFCFVRVVAPGPGRFHSRSCSSHLSVTKICHQVS
jgi:hypothetical protein